MKDNPYLFIHSPTPWTTRDGRLYDANGLEIDFEDGFRSEDIEFIVRAVNERESLLKENIVLGIQKEKLLEAAEGLVRSVSMNQYWKELPGAIKVNIAKADEAIALAEKDFSSVRQNSTATDGKGENKNGTVQS